MRWDEPTTLSVVICCYTERRWSALQRAIRGVLAQTPKVHELIVVVDHDPDLYERTKAAFPGIAVVANENDQGLSGARNTGVRHSTGDVVAFLDDDAYCAPEWSGTLLGGYRPDVAAVGGSAVPKWPGEAPAWLPDEFLWVVGCSWRGLPTEPAPVRNLIGTNMSIRREVLATVGAFTSTVGRVGARLSGCEETELCIRIAQRWPDAAILYLPNLAVDHYQTDDRTKLSYFARRCWSEGRSKATVATLVGSRQGLASERRHATRVIPAALVRTCRDLAHGRPGAMGRLLALAGGLLIAAGGFVYGRLRVGNTPVEGRSCDVMTATPWFGASIGGVETHVGEMTRRHRDSGLRVRVAACDPAHDLPRIDAVDEVVVERARAWPRSTDIGFAPGLIGIIRRTAPSVVHVQGVHTLAAPIAMLTAAVSRTPYIVTFHSGGHSASWRRHIRAFQWRALRPLLRRAFALVAVSDYERDLFADALAIPSDRITVIPNGVDVEVIPPRRAPRHGPLRILSIGRLERYKGHHRAIAAWPEICRMWPGSQLTIVGDGPAAAELHQQAADVGSDSIGFASYGRDERSAYFDLLRSADVVVVLSEYESQGIVVLEALACGVDVVVQNTTALAEYVSRRWAIGVPEGSSNGDLVKAIAESIRREPPPLSIPTWEMCADRLYELYQVCLVSRGARRNGQ
ncbi:MAG: glycosyltransferase [Acidimicrobiales bacterium]